MKKTKNSHSSASNWWEYSKYCFKENAKILSENSTTQDLVLKRTLERFPKFLPLKKLEFQNQKKKTMKFVQKENFEPKIKPMIENLQDQLYQYENKQGKGAKRCAGIRHKLEG